VAAGTACLLKRKDFGLIWVSKIAVFFENIQKEDMR
jgi:hypothetical protein